MMPSKLLGDEIIKSQDDHVVSTNIQIQALLQKNRLARYLLS